ncbi:hypothetical protein HPULCUR_005689 [Helicostylum pulchrum]|uniref:Uncharacterized protein n=1 Tax=Helicostylum pulchrum TaxID=562976 RepID=A0ABP9XZT3_9FUNG
MKDLVAEIKRPNISIIGSSLEGGIISAEGGSSVYVDKREKGKRKVEILENDLDISVKKNRKVFSFIKPTTLDVNYAINIPVLEQQEKSAIESVVFVKFDNDCICENDEVNEEFQTNNESQRNMRFLNQKAMVYIFLRNALDQKYDNFLAWICGNGFNYDVSEEERKANCMKPVALVQTNERTPFVECEKDLESNRYVSLYHADTVGRKHLADGVGYSTADLSEVLLMESSGEDDDAHTNEDTMKLLDCSIRGLKLETERLPNASFETFKKRRFFTCLCSKDKLTLMSTFMIDSKHWGLIKIADAIVPRHWFGRPSWLKVFELTLFLRASLEEQKQVSEKLLKEESGWLRNGATIFETIRI